MEVLKTFTNTDSEDFEGMFHGEPYTLKAGESKVFTEKLARHLANQLAYKVRIRIGVDKVTEDKEKEMAESYVGRVDIPEPVIETPKESVKVEKKEEEFEEIKPKKSRKRK